MARVLHRTADPVDYRKAVHTPDYDPAIWFINPDISAVKDVPTMYWARPLTDPVTEMNASEKAAVDQARKDAETQAARDAGADASRENTGVGTQNRGLIETFNKRDNYGINRIEEVQQVLLAIKATTGAADSIRQAIPDNFLATDTRDRSTAILDYQNTVNSGDVDAPQNGGTRRNR